jgi:hypothetical protein
VEGVDWIGGVGHAAILGPVGGCANASVT